LTIEGHPEDSAGEGPSADYRVTSADYFRTMGIPVLKGRAFTEQDDANSPGVIIVNKTMAARYWPDQDPVGNRVRLELRASR
jgi:hypothetical protein